MANELRSVPNLLSILLKRNRKINRDCRESEIGDENHAENEGSVRGLNGNVIGQLLPLIEETLSIKFSIEDEDSQNSMPKQITWPMLLVLGSLLY